MNPKFTPLDCDDDVILLERDTFTVCRFQELSTQAIRNKLNYSMNGGISNKYSTSALDFFSRLSLGEQNISFSEFQFNSIKDCKILKIGGISWQTGKLKINICISTQGRNLDKVCLEFCPDGQIDPESPLDDIRKLVEQK